MPFSRKVEIVGGLNIHFIVVLENDGILVGEVRDEVQAVGPVSTGFVFGVQGAGRDVRLKCQICGNSLDHFDTSMQCLVNMSAHCLSVTTYRRSNKLFTLWSCKN